MCIRLGLELINFLIFYKGVRLQSLLKNTIGNDFIYNLILKLKLLLVMILFII